MTNSENRNRSVQTMVPRLNTDDNSVQLKLRYYILFFFLSSYAAIIIVCIIYRTCIALYNSIRFGRSAGTCQWVCTSICDIQLAGDIGHLNRRGNRGRCWNAPYLNCNRIFLIGFSSSLAVMFLPCGMSAALGEIEHTTGNSEP